MGARGSLSRRSPGDAGATPSCAASASSPTASFSAAAAGLCRGGGGPTPKGGGVALLWRVEVARCGAVVAGAVDSGGGPGLAGGRGLTAVGLHLGWRWRMKAAVAAPGGCPDLAVRAPIWAGRAPIWATRAGPTRALGVLAVGAGAPGPLLALLWCARFGAGRLRAWLGLVAADTTLQRGVVGLVRRTGPTCCVRSATASGRWKTDLFLVAAPGPSSCGQIWARRARI